MKLVSAVCCDCRSTVLFKIPAGRFCPYPCGAINNKPLPNAVSTGNTFLHGELSFLREHRVAQVAVSECSNKHTPAVVTDNGCRIETCDTRCGTEKKQSDSLKPVFPGDFDGRAAVTIVYVFQSLRYTWLGYKAADCETPIFMRSEELL